MWRRGYRTHYLPQTLQTFTTNNLLIKKVDNSIPNKVAIPTGRLLNTISLTIFKRLYRRGVSTKWIPYFVLEQQNLNRRFLLNLDWRNCHFCRSAIWVKLDGFSQSHLSDHLTYLQGMLFLLKQDRLLNVLKQDCPALLHTSSSGQSCRSLERWWRCRSVCQDTLKTWPHWTIQSFLC